MNWACFEWSSPAWLSHLWGWLVPISRHIPNLKHIIWNKPLQLKILLKSGPVHGKVEHWKFKNMIPVSWFHWPLQVHSGCNALPGRYPVAEKECCPKQNARYGIHCHHEWPVESRPSCFLLSHKSSLCVIADLCNAGVSWSQLCPARGRTSSAGFECPCAYFLLFLYGNLPLPCSRYDHTQSGQDMPCLREEDNGGQPHKAWEESWFSSTTALWPLWTQHIKHRTNCECCPGHCLIVNHYSSMSWFNLNRCLCSHCSQCLLVSTCVY